MSPHFGNVNLERRQCPRFSTDLPAKYWQIDNSKNHLGHLVNISEGGVMLYFPEKIEIGQHLRVRLFIGPFLELEPIDALVLVAWNDSHFGKNGYSRIGVKFVDISPEHMDVLRNFLDTLITLKGSSESRIPSELFKDFGLSKLGNFSPLPPKPPNQD